MVLKKVDITEHLFEKLTLTQRDSKVLVEFFFEEIKKSLEQGEDVKLSGFGNFQIKYKNARPGRNPKTGKDFLITARRVVTFKAGHKLKNKIDNYLIKQNTKN